MTKIIRVHYEHQSDPNVKNTYVDFKLAPNQENVKSVEVREVIPEHTKVCITFQGEHQ